MTVQCCAVLLCTVEDDDDDDEDEEIEKVSVPLTITMGLVAGFIFMGSVLFAVWEGWDWLSSAYYCFVTISTIGFGDLVPGSEGFRTTADNLKMIAAAAYIVFGMAIMSMAFNLIQVDLLGFLARDVIYTSRAYATMSVSVCLSVTEVHWRIIANLGFKFRSHFTVHCGRRAARRAACGRIISRHASQC